MDEYDNKEYTPPVSKRHKSNRFKKKEEDKPLSSDEIELRDALLIIYKSTDKKHAQMFHTLYNHIKKVGEEKAAFNKPKKLVKRLGLLDEDDKFEIRYKVIHAALVAYVLKLDPDKVSIYAISMLTNKTREDWEDIYSVAVAHRGEKEYPSDKDIKASKKEILEPDTSPGADYHGDGPCITDNAPCQSFDELYPDYESFDGDDEYFLTRGEGEAIDLAMSRFLKYYPDYHDIAFKILSLDNRHFQFDLYRLDIEIINVREYGLERFKSMAKAVKFDDSVE